MEKRQISDDMTVLLRQLVMQNQIKMAGLVLRTYLIRHWKIDERLAGKFTLLYFSKHYPKQLERYQKLLNRVG